MLKPSTHQRLTGLALLLLIFHAGIFIKFTIDDAYITFTYTKNLAQGNGPVFTPGNHVEATSSMLWAGILVPFETFLNNGAVIGSKILGLFSLLGTVFVGILLIQELLGTNPFVGYASLAFSFLMAGASSFVVWGTYGMENGLVALLLTASVLLFLKEQQSGHGFASAFVIFLLETVRPEGFIYISLFVGVRLFFAFHPEGKGRFKQNLYWISLLAGCLIIYEIFGFAYFGHLLPNTVQAKVGGMSYERFMAGVRYLKEPYALPGSVLLMLCSLLLLLRFFISIVRKRRINFFLQLLLKEIPIVFIYCTLLIHWIFVIYIGGDWMPNARFLSHFIPLLLVLLVVLFSQVAMKLLPSKKSPAMNAAIFLTSISFFSAYYSFNAINSIFSYQIQLKLQGAEEHALTGMASLLNHLAEGKESVVACSDIGRMGYYFKGKVIDWWGLADEEVTHKGQALGQIDPAVILRRKPDFIVLYSNEPILSSNSMQNNMAVYSKVFFDNPDFLLNYQQIDSLFFWNRRWHVLFQRRPNRLLHLSGRAGH